MVVWGGLRSAAHTVSWRDPVGLAIALAAAISISVYFVWVGKTRSWLPESAILYINYASVFAFAPLASGAAFAESEFNDWDRVKLSINSDKLENTLSWAGMAAGVRHPVLQLRLRLRRCAGGLGCVRPIYYQDHI